MNFLFWNTNNRNVDDVLIDLIINESLDIVILAEYVRDSTSLLKKLMKRDVEYYKLSNIGCKRINIFTRLTPSHFKYSSECEYYTIRELKQPGHLNLLMAFVHLPSKLYMTESDQLQETICFKEELERAEAKNDNRNSIVLGDFNMNPFEPGMIAASSMHSIPCSKTAKKGTRTIKGRDHTMFYNPMWNLFGDFNEKPGTYFHSSSMYNAIFWNMPDQIILRPHLVQYFDKDSLKIIDSTPTQKLTNLKGHPNVSDHLPIMFSMNLFKEAINEKSLA